MVTVLCKCRNSSVVEHFHGKEGVLGSCLAPAFGDSNHPKIGNVNKHKHVTYFSKHQLCCDIIKLLLRWALGNTTYQGLTAR